MTTFRLQPIKTSGNDRKPLAVRYKATSPICSTRWIYWHRRGSFGTEYGESRNAVSELFPHVAESVDDFVHHQFHARIQSGTWRSLSENTHRQRHLRSAPSFGSWIHVLGWHENEKFAWLKLRFAPTLAARWHEEFGVRRSLACQPFRQRPLGERSHRLECRPRNQVSIQNAKHVD